MTTKPTHYLLEDWLDARRAQRLLRRARRAAPVKAEHLRRLAATPAPHKPIALNRSVQ